MLAFFAKKVKGNESKGKSGNPDKRVKPDKPEEPKDAEKGNESKRKTRTPERTRRAYKQEDPAGKPEGPKKKGEPEDPNVMGEPLGPPVDKPGLHNVPSLEVVVEPEFPPPVKGMEPQLIATTPSESAMKTAKDDEPIEQAGSSLCSKKPSKATIDIGFPLSAGLPRSYARNHLAPEPADAPAETGAVRPPKSTQAAMRVPAAPPSEKALYAQKSAVKIAVSYSSLPPVLELKSTTTTTSSASVFVNKEADSLFRVDMEVNSSHRKSSTPDEDITVHSTESTVADKFSIEIVSRERTPHRDQASNTGAKKQKWMQPFHCENQQQRRLLASEQRRYSTRGTHQSIVFCSQADEQRVQPQARVQLQAQPIQAQQLQRQLQEPLLMQSQCLSSQMLHSQPHHADSAQPQSKQPQITQPPVCQAQSMQRRSVCSQTLLCQAYQVQNPQVQPTQPQTLQHQHYQTQNTQSQPMHPQILRPPNCQPQNTQAQSIQYDTVRPQPYQTQNAQAHLMHSQISQPQAYEAQMHSQMSQPHAYEAQNAQSQLVRPQTLVSEALKTQQLPSAFFTEPKLQSLRPQQFEYCNNQNVASSCPLVQQQVNAAAMTCGAATVLDACCRSRTQLNQNLAPAAPTQYQPAGYASPPTQCQANYQKALLQNLQTPCPPGCPVPATMAYQGLTNTVYPAQSGSAYRTSSPLAYDAPPPYGESPVGSTVIIEKRTSAKPKVNARSPAVGVLSIEMTEQKGRPRKSDLATRWIAEVVSNSSSESSLPEILSKHKSKKGHCACSPKSNKHRGKDRRDSRVCECGHDSKSCKGKRSPARR
ncbi:uncharacterized protein LOC135392802 [Ornithodoros turicata]|uniref:uncharacterized protein LOC135392802 n=1 Tax=Ornithodoros turicata TaxID=34597 RepID=UPI00313900AC